MDFLDLHVDHGEAKARGSPRRLDLLLEGGQLCAIVRQGRAGPERDQQDYDQVLHDVSFRFHITRRYRRRSIMGERGRGRSGGFSDPGALPVAAT